MAAMPRKAKVENHTTKSLQALLFWVSITYSICAVVQRFHIINLSSYLTIDLSIAMVAVQIINLFRAIKDGHELHSSLTFFLLYKGTPLDYA